MSREYIYVIKNEWWPKGDEVSQVEIVSGRYFRAHDEAWERLSQIAEAYHVSLDPDQESFTVPLAAFEDAGDQEYYIDELWSY